jgi:hypothetical protein
MNILQGLARYLRITLKKFAFVNVTLYLQLQSMFVIFGQIYSGFVRFHECLATYFEENIFLQNLLL